MYLLDVGLVYIGFSYNDHVPFGSDYWWFDYRGMMEMRSCVVFMSQQTIYTLAIFFLSILKRSYGQICPCGKG